ncbi:MAG: hypothetical protein ACLP0B_02720 [Steroidobacteraceae bacterium]
MPAQLDNPLANRIGFVLRSHMTAPLVPLTTLAFLCVIYSLCGVLASRFYLGFGPFSFEMISNAVSFARSHDVQTLFSFSVEPIGYALILFPLLSAGLGPLVSALAVTIVGNFLSLALLGLITYEIFERRYRWAVLSCVIYIFQYGILGCYQKLWVESVFTASVLFMYWVMLTFWYSARSRRLSFSSIGILSISISLPTYLRYVGIAFIAAAFIFLLADSLLVRARTLREALIVIVLSSMLLVPQFLGNALWARSITGHPVGVTPGYTFPEALWGFLYYTGVYTFVPLPKALPGSLTWLSIPYEALLVAFVVCVLIALAFISLYMEKLRFCLFCIVMYIVAFSVAESITRIDNLQFRFIYPIIPLMLIVVISIFYYSYYKIPIDRISERIRVGVQYLFGSILCLVLIGGLVVMGLGIPAVQSMNYSPETLAEALKIIPRDATVIISRWGGQLTMFRPDISLVQIPASDAYNEAYGSKTWDNNTLSNVIRARNIKLMIFFLGRQQGDALENGSYGPAIEEAYQGNSPIVASRRRLSDGVILFLN